MENKNSRFTETLFILAFVIVIAIVLLSVAQGFTDGIIDRFLTFLAV